MQSHSPFATTLILGHLYLIGRGRQSMTAQGITPERAAAEWFIALREDPEDSALRARFDTWHDADPRHAEAWAEMGETARIIQTAPPERRTYDLPDKALRAASDDGRSARRTPRSSVSRLRPLRQAAAIAVAACLALVIAPMVTLRMNADHISGTGEVETVRLEDGSVVQLGPDSAIAVDYKPGHRDIRLLSGQAMFEVRSDPSRPFRVAARDVTTTVLGTGFDVRMIGDATSVAVRHGRVRVEAGGEVRELAAGDWTRVTSGALPSVGHQAPELVGQWRGGKVVIRNQPISEAIDELRPWYGGKIILADRALGAKLVSGAYDTRDPRRSLGLMLTPYGGRVYQISPWLMIVTAQ